MSKNKAIKPVPIAPLLDASTPCDLQFHAQRTLSKVGEEEEEQERRRKKNRRRGREGEEVSYAMCYVGKATKIFFFLTGFLLLLGLVVGFGLSRHGWAHKAAAAKPCQYSAAGGACSSIFPDPIPADAAAAPPIPADTFSAPPPPSAAAEMPQPESALTPPSTPSVLPSPPATLPPPAPAELPPPASAELPPPAPAELPPPAPAELPPPAPAEPPPPPPPSTADPTSASAAPPLASPGLPSPVQEATGPAHS